VRENLGTAWRRDEAREKTIEQQMWDEEKRVNRHGSIYREGEQRIPCSWMRGKKEKGKKKMACNNIQSRVSDLWKISGLRKMVLTYEFPLARYTIKSN
jgi:hypothetical protein